MNAIQSLGKKDISVNLINSKDMIIQEWIKKVHSNVNSDKRENEPSLLDSIPQLLDKMVEALEHGLNPHEIKANLRIAKKHGHQRVQIKNYRLEEVVDEYHILRGVIGRVLEDKEHLSFESHSIINGLIDEAISLAIDEFMSTETRVDEQKREEKRLTVINPEDVKWSSDAFFEISDLLLCVAGHDGYFKRINKAWEVILGYSPQEMLSAPWIDFVHPEDKLRTIEAGEAISKGHSTINFFNRYKTKDGNYRWLHWSTTPFGNVSYAVARDVTDFKETESKFQSVTKQLNFIANASPTYIAQVDRNLRFLFLNSSYEKWFNKPRIELIGKTLEEIFEPKSYDCVRPFIDRVLKGEEVNFEQEFRCQAGEIKHYRVSYIPEVDERGEVKSFVVNATDINDLKRKEVELKELLEDLKLEKDLREKFVATLSHDLRTPLTVAKMCSQLLIKHKHNIETIKEIPGRILQSIERTDQMITDLLNVTQIRFGNKIPLEIIPVDLSELFKNTIEELSSIHGDRFRLISPISLKFPCDIKGMRRILENLCANAIKYGDCREITVTLEDLSDKVKFKVHNFGNPIREQDKELLFKQFKRLESAERSNVIGWGLGLALVQGIVEAHGGSVGVDSCPEKGTVFYVDLPKNQ